MMLTLICVLKLMAQHKLDWVNFPYMEKGYDQWIDDIKADEAGNIYTRQTKIGVYSGSSAPFFQKIVKQDPFGNVVWETLISTAAVGEEVLEPLLVQQNGFLYTPVSDGVTYLLLRVNENTGVMDTLLSQPVPSPDANGIYYGIVQGYNGMLYCYGAEIEFTRQIFIYETDTAGTLLHTYHYVPTASYVSFSNMKSVYTDGAGNVYTEYGVPDTGQLNYTRHLKFNGNGTLAYDTIFGNAASNAFLLSVDSDGNSLWMNGTVIYKLDNLLNILWTYSISLSVAVDPTTAIVDKDGNLYFVVNGTYGSNMSFLFKLHSNGSLAYRYHLPDENATGCMDVKLAVNGDVLLPAISYIFTDANDYLCHNEVVELVRLDSAGTLKEWLHDTIFYTLATPVPIARNVLLPNGDVYITGEFINPPSNNYASNDSARYSMYVGLWYTAKFCQACGRGNVDGKVGVDTVGSCVVDSASPAALNSMVFLSPGTRAAVVGNNGVYQFSQVPPGNYSVSVSPPPYLFNNCDSVIALTIDSVTPRSNNNFSLAAYPGCNMSLAINGTRARAGHLQQTNVVYFNQMWQPSTGMLAVTIDPLFIYDSAQPSPDSVAGSTYFWKFNNLQPYYQKSVNIYSTVGVTDTYSVNYFHVYGSVYTNCNGPNALITDTLTDYIYSSFDPNGKDVFPLINRKYMQFIDKNAPLTFQVNFQNTGNDTAFRVVLRDTIDANFNLKTLRFIGSSSPCNMTVGPARDVAFTFINMKLPPADTNEAMSCGYVKYSIVPNDSIILGQSVSNRASIYFDFNNPVVTNTSSLQYVKLYTGINELETDVFTLNLYPNPTQGQFVIETQNFNAQSIIIYDEAGRQIKNTSFKTQTDISNLSSGVYFVEVKGTEGVLRKRVVKM